MARSPARRFSWEGLARTDSQVTIHVPLGTLYLRRLQRGDESYGKVDSDAAQDQGHEEQGRVRHQGRRRHPERLHRQGRSGRQPPSTSSSSESSTASPCPWRRPSNCATSSDELTQTWSPPRREGSTTSRPLRFHQPKPRNPTSPVKCDDSRVIGIFRGE